MTHILVKSGRVIVQGGRVLTSQGGAPCFCGPEGCVIVLLPCCSCPGSLAYMRDTPQVQAVWPFDTRDDGRIVRMLDGRCYRYVATVPEIPDAATREYVFDNIGGFVDECGDPRLAELLFAVGHAAILERLPGRAASRIPGRRQDPLGWPRPWRHHARGGLADVP